MNNFKAIDPTTLSNQIKSIIGNVQKQKQILADMLPHAVFNASNKSNHRRLDGVNLILTAVQEFSDSGDLVKALKVAIPKMIHSVVFDDKGMKFKFKNSNLKSRNLIDGFETVNFLEFKPKKPKKNKPSNAGITEKKIEALFNLFTDETDNAFYAALADNVISLMDKSDAFAAELVSRTAGRELPAAEQTEAEQLAAPEQAAPEQAETEADQSVAA